MPSLRKDDVALFYEETDGGEPPIVLVHGWCCDHTYDPQFDHFLQRGRRLIAVDLRGHGRSDKPNGRYSMQAFAGLRRAT
jgi:pimeloyl-ACP methyl ester carboxylesterase